MCVSCYIHTPPRYKKSPKRGIFYVVSKSGFEPEVKDSTMSRFCKNSAAKTSGMPHSPATRGAREYFISARNIPLHRRGVFIYKNGEDRHDAKQAYEKVFGQRYCL